MPITFYQQQIEFLYIYIFQLCLKKDIKSLNWDKVLKIKIFLYKIFEEQPNVYKKFRRGTAKNGENHTRFILCGTYLLIRLFEIQTWKTSPFKTVPTRQSLKTNHQKVKRSSWWVCILKHYQRFLIDEVNNICSKLLRIQWSSV